LSFQPKEVSLSHPVRTCANPSCYVRASVVMRLFRDHGIYSQICGNNFMVLK